jgi:hypothetical protein
VAVFERFNKITTVKDIRVFLEISLALYLQKNARSFLA